MRVAGLLSRVTRGEELVRGGEGSGQEQSLDEMLEMLELAALYRWFGQNGGGAGGGGAKEVE